MLDESETPGIVQKDGMIIIFAIARHCYDASFRQSSKSSCGRSKSQPFEQICKETFAKDSPVVEADCTSDLPVTGSFGQPGVSRQKDKLHGRCPVSGRDELGLDMGYGGLRATRLFGSHSLRDPSRVDTPTSTSTAPFFFLATTAAPPPLPSFAGNGLGDFISPRKGLDTRVI